MKFYLIEDFAKFKLCEDVSSNPGLGSGTGFLEAKDTNVFEEQNSVMKEASSWDQAYQAAQGNASELGLFWRLYYDYEWGNKAKSLQELGEGIETELRHFGFTADTNPYLRYLQITGYITADNPLKLDADRYAVLHNQWDKAITDAVLRGETTADSAGYITTNLIANKGTELFKQNPGAIEDYLDIILVVDKNWSSIESKLKTLKETNKITTECSIVQLIYTLLKDTGKVYTTLEDLNNAALPVDASALKTAISPLRPIAQASSMLEKILGQTIQKKAPATNKVVIDALAGADKEETLLGLALYLMIQTAGDNILNISKLKSYCEKLRADNKWSLPVESLWPTVKIPLEDTAFITAVQKLQVLDINDRTITDPILLTIVQKLNNALPTT